MIPLRKLPTKSFKVKIIKIFLVVSLLPVIIIAGSNLYLVIKTRQNNIVELENLVLANTGEKIINVLDENSEALNLKVSAPINSISDLPANSLYSLLMTSFSSAEFNWLNIIDNYGKIIAKTSKNGRVAINKLYLDRVNQDFILGQESDGSYITKNAVDTISYVESDVSATEDYLTAKEGNNFFGTLMFEENPVITMASPITNQNGEIIGVASAEVGLNKVSDIIKNAKIGNEGYLYLIYNDGRVISSGNSKLLITGTNGKEIKYIKKIVDGDVSDLLNVSDNYTQLRNSLNKSISLSVLPMWKLKSDLNWFLYSEWPIDDAFSVIDNILKWSFYLTVATLIFVIILGIIFTGQIVKPINALRKGAKEISAGNFDYKINLKTNDEFEILAGKFNEMIKVLKENQKLRDEFVFISAHELRTPVTAIKGYVSMILDNSFGEVPEKIRENLNIVNASNDRLVQLVHDLLEIARSEAGKMKIEIKEVPILENVETVVNELKPLADKKNIKVTYKSMEKYAQVKADSFKLKEVITNLLGNAIKYTIDNGDITISHEIKDKELITHIKDHGIGMSEEETKKLFGKFFRAQNDDTKEIEGTGLGLFICKEIIERMGGKIWVTSKRGEGSTFSFSLEKA